MIYCILFGLAYFLFVGLVVYGFWRSAKNAPRECQYCASHGKPEILVKRGEKCNCGWENEK